MDPKILSLEEFADEPRTDLNATDAARGDGIQLLGGLLATSPETRTLRKRKVAPSTMAKQRSRRPISSDSMETSKSSGGDEVGGAPQRGRPRLDASNQTRGEVWEKANRRRWRVPTNFA